MTKFVDCDIVVPMASTLSIVAALFIHPGCEVEFAQFETAAELIMQRYGGRLERRIGIPPSADQPHEVHLVTFPDQESFDRYRADADLLAMADLRARAIRQTIAWIGSDFPGFLRK